MKIKTDLKKHIIDFDCHAISIVECNDESILKYKIKQLILEDFASKLYSIFEENYNSIPYSIRMYRLFDNKYFQHEVMTMPNNYDEKSIDISIDETIEYCEKYFSTMVDLRFPVQYRPFNYDIRKFFGEGEFPFIISLILYYKDNTYWAYEISR